MFAAGLPSNIPQLQTRKALLAIDLQNDLVGLAHPVLKDDQGGCPYVNRTRRLVQDFREVGEIVWIRTQYQDDRPIVDETTNTPLLILGRRHSRHAKDEDSDAVEPFNSDASEEDYTDAFLSTSPSGQSSGLCRSEFGVSKAMDHPDELSDLQNGASDHFVFKTQYSALKSTALLFSLRMRLITHLYLCGSLSNISVYATALDAVQHGFTITLVDDCLGYYNETAHAQAMNLMVQMMGAQIITSRDVIGGETEPNGEAETGELSDFSESTSHSVHLENHVDQLRLSSEQAKHPEPESIEVDPEPTADLHESSYPFSRKRMSVELDVADSDEESDDEPLITNATYKRAAGGTFSMRRVLRDERPAARMASRRQQSNSRSPPSKTSPASFCASANPKVEQSQPLSGVPSAEEHARSNLSPVQARPERDDIADSNSPMLSPANRANHDPVKEERSHSSPHDSSSLPTSTLLTTSLPTRTTSRADANASYSRPRKRSRTIDKMDSAELGLAESIAEGDCRVVHDALPPSLARTVFQQLKDEVHWQKMHHRGGEVPRLVAVQGEIDVDGSIPIYRHPADESPTLYPFSKAVSAIREVVEETLQFSPNHVLIQHYRDGQDYISEHSDKTLDIVRGSGIVNVSFGASRTMTLRTKKATTRPTQDNVEHEASHREVVSPRETQKVPLPDNSMFVLGEATNRVWLHGIRPDKRPTSEKTVEETSHDGERISLTFRRIGTFSNPATRCIWGQGARSKTKDTARLISEAPEDIEAMIIAFGKENHQPDFDWDREYGGGFDVVNIAIGEAQLAVPTDAAKIISPSDAAELPSSIDVKEGPPYVSSAILATTSLGDCTVQRDASKEPAILTRKGSLMIEAAGIVDIESATLATE